jgi:hypothetical protein
MRARLSSFALAGILILCPAVAYADCDLDEVIGYTLAAKKTISGRIEQDGTRNNDYQGCTFGRIIVFNDNTGVRCATYTYTLAFSPTAYLFVSGASIKMCVESSWVSVSPLR